MADFPAVELLLPHQPPMRLIEDIVAANQDGLWATLLLKSDSPFMDKSRVRALVALEYLAQASAAWFALRARQVTDEPVRAGMLITCSRLMCSVAHFHSGERLLVFVEPVSRLPASGSGMVKFRGQVFVQADGILPERLLLDETPAVDAGFSVYL